MSNDERADSAGQRRGKAAKVARGDMNEEIVVGLRQLLGPTSRWRSIKQMESMKAIIALKDGETAISVLPTGAGKSILFMLPAVMRYTGTSVVVVPFTALMDDIVDRAIAMGVDCIQFQTAHNTQRESLPRAARMVVVSADVVTSGGFLAYMDGLKTGGLLRRIFIDESHTIIMDVSYRAKLGELRSLHRFECPIVMLTATLPTALESWFRDEMLAKSAVMVRDRTTKLNCRYRVQQVKPGKDPSRTARSRRCSASVRGC